MQRINPFDQLSNELVIQLMKKLESKDFFNFAQISKRFNNLSYHQQLIDYTLLRFENIIRKKNYFVITKFLDHFHQSNLYNHLKNKNPEAMTFKELLCFILMRKPEDTKQLRGTDISNKLQNFVGNKSPLLTSRILLESFEIIHYALLYRRPNEQAHSVWVYKNHQFIEYIPLNLALQNRKFSYYINLSGLDLSRASLHHTNLKFADFRQTNLTGASFIHADLTNANLINTILDSTCLTNTIFNSIEDSSDAYQTLLLSEESLTSYETLKNTLDSWHKKMYQYQKDGHDTVKHLCQIITENMRFWLHNNTTKTVDEKIDLLDTIMTHPLFAHQYYYYHPLHWIHWGSWQDQSPYLKLLNDFREGLIISKTYLVRP